MGLLQRLVQGMSGDRKEFKEKFKEAEMQLKIEKTLEERQKSSNRRELERWEKDQEEKQIKEALDKIHKQQNKENWKSPHQVLSKGKSILKDDRPILKEKNIFLDKKNNIPFVKGENQFFKW